MDDVTDVAFRAVIAKYGAPDVMFTEFTSADGLVRAPEPGKSKLLKKLQHCDAERPVVAQLFSAVPERMEGAAAIVREHGLDGVDINTGCPDRTVEKQGCGAALIKNPALFIELFEAVRRGVAGSIPVSVKCRLGYARPEIDTWIRTILEQKPHALTVHLRTREELSKVPAHWELMPEIVALRNEVSPETVIIGNGDVRDVHHARTCALESGCDGVMLGRAMFGNPWFATEHIPTKTERIRALIEHVHIFDTELGTTKSFAVMKKHFASYMSHFDGAHELRVRLMDTHSAEDALAVLHSAV